MDKSIEWIKDGIELYKENFVIILACSAITLILSFFTIGILAGPLLVGLYRIISRLHLKSEPKPEIQDIFKGFDTFLQAFIVGFGLWLINVIISVIFSFLASNVSSLALIASLIETILFVGIHAVTLFAIPLVALKGLDAIPSIQKSIDTTKPNLKEFIIFSFLSSMIASVGAFLLGIGIFLTVPVAITSIAIAYHELFETEKAEPKEA